MRQHRSAQQPWVSGSWPRTRIQRIVCLYDADTTGIVQAVSRIKQQVLDPTYVQENPTVSVRSYRL